MGFKLEDISLSIDGHDILKNISLDVEEGEFICLLGPSGCGKTTTLRILAGLETPGKGRVFLNEVCVNNDSTFIQPENRNIGFLFQDFALFPHLNIAENVAFGLSKKEKSPARVSDVLKTVKMDGYDTKYPHMLSGGQQQRVALARAMAPNPQIMLLDEPFSGLDTALRQQVREETSAILKENDVTTVMVTHDPEEAMYMADRIVLMNEGEIVQIGTPEELFDNPVNAFCANFLGDTHQFESVVKDASVALPVGKIATPHLNDGCKVSVLVRPDALKLEIPESASNEAEELFQIDETRYLGTHTQVQLKFLNGYSHLAPLTLKTPADFEVKCDDYVNVDLNTDKAYVFPKA